MGNRNNISVMRKINSRKKGHAFEQAFCKTLRAYGWKAITARSESKNMDDLGCDIIDDTPWIYQLKAVERLSPGYHEILREMIDNGLEKPLVVHKRNNKGSVVAMRLEDFLEFVLGEKNGTRRKEV